jgi:hypothetical protein
MITQGESQEKITATGIIDAYEKMGYDAVAVGPLDLAAGADFLKQQDRPILPWISANLLNTDNRPVFRPFIIKQTGQSTTGIIGLTGTSSLQADLHTGDWHTILPAQLQILSKKCDHIILLSNLPEKENYEIAQHYPEIRIIISADPQFSNLGPLINNKTIITQTAQQGKYLGRLGIEWGNTGTWESGLDQLQGTSPKDTLPSTFTSHFIALQSSLPNSTAVENIVSGIKQRISRLNTTAPQANSIHRDTMIQETPQSLAGFAGFKRCATCHQAQTDFWKSTQHAGSYATLLKVGQANNLECLPCHVTHETSLFNQDPADLTELLSLPSSMQTVGCEACHGTGRAHADNPQAVKPVRRTDKEVCLQCHTTKRDPAFNYEKKIKLIQCPAN